MCWTHSNLILKEDYKPLTIFVKKITNMDVRYVPKYVSSTSDLPQAKIYLF